MVYDMEQPVVDTLYIAHPLDLPPMTALAAFDGHREAARLGGTHEAWVVATPSAELCSIGSGVVERTRPSSALRRTQGRLRQRGALVSLAVELEVAPWSTTRCEIGIRPCGRKVPLTDSRRRRRYLALAVEAAEGLAHALERRVEDWMRLQLRHACSFSFTPPGATKPDLFLN
jgi:hypothetical protein